MYKILAKLSFGASNLHYLPSCHSTNEVAQNLVKAGCNEGNIVITDDQFAGKGQTGNTWQSEPSRNLTFSLVLKPAFLSPNEQFMLTVAVSRAIQDTLAEYLPGEVKIKWPNDIYFGERKIAGILIENVLRGSEFEYCIIGIGLNVNQESFPGVDRAVSMKLISGEEFDRNEILNSLLLSVDNYYTCIRNGEGLELKKKYHENLLGKGEERQFRTAGNEFTGIIQATDEHGRLIVWSPEKTYRFNHKEVEMLF